MRYGFRPKDARNPNDISITEMEYRRAKELGMPMLIYIMSDNHPPPDTTGMGLKQMREAQADFFESDPRGIEKLDLLKKEFMANEIVGFFDSAEDLRIKILQSLTMPSLKTAAQAYFEKQQELLKSKGDDEPASAPQSDIPYPPELYAYPPYSGQGAVFVGRREEMHALAEWSAPQAKQPMMVLVAIGGMGKSALTWRWVQDRAVPFEGIFWYSFYEGGAEMGDFVRHALAYVTRVSPESLLKTSFPQMLSQLTHALKNGRYLLVLDGLERVLVAYHRWNAAQMQDDEIEEGRDYRDCTNPRDNDVLKQLAGCEPSRILITSRLMPNALTDAGKALSSVKHLELRGLSRTDAQSLWREQGITWQDDGVMDAFVQQFGRHSLLLKLLIDIIKKTPSSKGDFQRWFELYGKDFDVFKDVKAKRHHILKFAYEGLSVEAQKLLSQMAALGNAIDIDTLNVFNPYMNMPEVLPEPREPHDDDWWYDSDEEKEDAKRQYQEQKKQYEAYLKANANYEKSDKYKHAIHQFDALLQDLEERGLIWWDVNNRQYDLHPVVRGYAFSQLSEADKPQTFDNIYNYFDAQERDNERTQFTSYAEMQNLIAMYNALIGAGKYDAAAYLFLGQMGDSLIFEELGLYHKAYELLLPLFANGLSELPIVTTQNLKGNILNQMGLVLYYWSRNEDALLVQANEIGIYLTLTNMTYLIVGLQNYARSLRDINCLAQSLTAFQLSLELAQVLNDKRELDFICYFLVGINTLLGRWQSAKIAYKNFIKNPSEISFHIRIHADYATCLLQQEADPSRIKSLLDDGDKLNQDMQIIYNKRNILCVRGDLALCQADYNQAIWYYIEAAKIGNEQGARYPEAWSGLARAYALNGNLTEARRIIEDGVEDHGFSAAVVYMTNGDLEEAKTAAFEFYTWAWAQGEPYVRRWELDQAKQILAQLGVDEPQLPVWDESKYEPFAHEEEIRALIEKLKQEREDEDSKSED